MRPSTISGRLSRCEPGSVLLALAVLVASAGAVLLAARETKMRERGSTSTGLSTRVPPIDAAAPAKVETMSFGLG